MWPAIIQAVGGAYQSYEGGRTAGKAADATRAAAEAATRAAQLQLSAAQAMATAEVAVSSGRNKTILIVSGIAVAGLLLFRFAR